MSSLLFELSFVPSFAADRMRATFPTACKCPGILDIAIDTVNPMNKFIFCPKCGVTICMSSLEMAESEYRMGLETIYLTSYVSSLEQPIKKVAKKVVKKVAAKKVYQKPEPCCTVSSTPEVSTSEVSNSVVVEQKQQPILTTASSDSVVESSSLPSYANAVCSRSSQPWSDSEVDDENINNGVKSVEYDHDESDDETVNDDDHDDCDDDDCDSHSDCSGSSRVTCKFGDECYNTSIQHLVDYHDSPRMSCRFAECTNEDVNHSFYYSHAGDADFNKKCPYSAQECTNMTPAHRAGAHGEQYEIRKCKYPTCYKMDDAVHCKAFSHTKSQAPKKTK